MGNLLHSGRIIAGQRNLLITPRIGWKTTSFWLVSSCWFGSKRLKVKFLLLGREAKTHSKHQHLRPLEGARGGEKDGFIVGQIILGWSRKRCLLVVELLIDSTH